MKIFRGPKMSDNCRLTDSKRPRDYIKHWRSNGMITFNGTIEGGERFTKLGLEIEEDDVIALFNALIKKYRKSESEFMRDLKASWVETRRLRAETARLRNKLDRLKN